MASGNYAEPIRSLRAGMEIFNEFQKHGTFHLLVTPAVDHVWGRGGMDIDDLEMSDYTIPVAVIKLLFEKADESIAVNFGNGYYGMAFEVAGELYWVAPRQEDKLDPGFGVDTLTAKNDVENL